MWSVFLERKKAWEERARDVPLAPPVEWGAVVVDNFCGMGALLLALATERVPIARYFGVDLDPVSGLMLMEVAEYCLQYMSHSVRWESVAHMFHLWRDVSTVGVSELQELGPVSIMGCGSPCQGFSRASRRARGFADPRSMLFFEGIRLRDAAARLALGEERPFFWYFENVEPDTHRVCALRHGNEHCRRRSSGEVEQRARERVTAGEAVVDKP